MTSKKLITILSTLIGLDIILTILFVSFFDAIEINPLCQNFEIFMIIKILLSIICIYIITKLQNIPYWKYFIITIISIYAGLLIFNISGIIQNF